MTDMVERVARAMLKASNPRVDPDALTPAPRGQAGLIPKWAMYEHLAKAAIKAMREPNDAMLDCGVAFALQASVAGFGGWSKYVAAKHRAMIDVAVNATPQDTPASTNKGE